MIAEADPGHMVRAEALVKPDILMSQRKEHVALVAEVRQEIQHDYEFSVRKSIGEPCRHSACFKCRLKVNEYQSTSQFLLKNCISTIHYMQNHATLCAQLTTY